jgi:hypothetical protein
MANQPTPIFTLKNLFIVALILALIYLLTCNKKTEVAPVIKPSTEVVTAMINVDSIKSAVADSFTTVIVDRDVLIRKQNSEYDDLLAEYLNFQNDLTSALQKPVPDTCKPIVAALSKQFNQLKNTSTQKDKSANTLINSLKEQNKNKDKFLAAEKKSYKDLHNVLDTCVKGYKQLEQAVKKLQPHNKLAVGVVANVYPVFGYGIGADFIHKKGTIVSVSAMMMNNQTYGQVGIKKVISFRKN